MIRIFPFLGLFLLAAFVSAQEAAGSSQRTSPRFGGPDAVEDQLARDAEPVESFFDRQLLPGFTAWKNKVQVQNGLNVGFDYSAVYLSASESLGADRAASGMLRFFGSWDRTGRDSDSTSQGSFIWKIENRHKYTTIPPAALGFETGYVGLHVPPFNDQKARLTNSYWRQRWDKLTLVAGFLDTTDYLDVYALASPWTGFVNFAFSTGTTTIPLPNDAALGVAAGAWLTDRLFVIGSITDTNSDPSDPLDGFNTFFDDREYFRSFEIGTTNSADRIYLDNMHLTIWQVDSRARVGTPSGWGANFSYTRYINEKWLPFIRAGYADDGGSLMEQSLSVGVGYQAIPARNLLGVGFNWGDPNRNTFPDARSDQYTLEVFYRINISSEIVVTPDIQLIKDPALNPSQNTIWVLGLRARLAF